MKKHKWYDFKDWRNWGFDISLGKQLQKLNKDWDIKQHTYD